MDPARRRLYAPDFLERGARNLVGIFRTRYAEHVGEPEFDELVGALTAGSPLFLRLWNERETQPLLTYEVLLEHPTLGPLRFHSVRATPGDGSANTLYLLPPADEATVAAMRRAISLADNDHRQACRPSRRARRR